MSSGMISSGVGLNPPEPETGAPALPDFSDERPLPGYVRVDLLPESLRERERIARAKRFAALFVVITLLLLAGLYALARNDLSAAETELAAAEGRNAELQAQLAQFAEVPAAFAAADAANAALSGAMAREVRWSFLLNQLSFVTPSGVTLDSIAGQIAEGVTPNSPGGVLPLKDSVGTVTFSGTGTTFAEVAAWLDSLTALKDYTYPFLTNSTKDETTGDITWESTADLSTNALSGRYGTPEPAAPATTGQSGEPAPSAAPEPTPADGAGDVQ